jgi:hypothetical protein
MVTIVNTVNQQQIMYSGQTNTIISHNILDEARFFETFSTYKIFSLELISIFCSIRVSFEPFFMLTLKKLFFQIKN